MKQEAQSTSPKNRDILKDFWNEEELFSVHQQLEPFIASILHGQINFPFIDKFVARPIPSCCVLMVIHFGNKIMLYDTHFKNPQKYFSFVIGLHALNKLSYLHAPGNVDNIVIAFRPGGFSHIFNRPAFDLVNRNVDLSELVPPDIMGKISDLKSIKSFQERILRLNGVFLDLLTKYNFKASINHIEALDYIHKSQGNISLNAICENLGVSARTIERSFRGHVGISPKEYIRIVRFNSIFKYLLENRFEDWHEVVHQYGYFDQSHFIHDFKAVTGFTPGEFIAFHEHGMIFLDRFQLVYRIEDVMHRCQMLGG